MPFIKNLKSKLVARVPILDWGQKYNTHKFVSDAIAGITVALTVMPQALAYATLAGLEPQYGLYSAFVGCFIYTIFGTCKDITIGPTALMALMTYQQIIGRNSDYAILLCFLSGVVQLLMAVLNLGVLIDFISIPVTVGFTSATSVIIMTSQIKSLLGLKISSSGFLDTVTKVFQNIHQTRLADCALGISCIVILMALRKLKDYKVNPKEEPSNNQQITARSLWLISTSRNALVVIICSTIAYCYEVYGSGSPFRLTGTVRPGLPDLKPPPFETILHNRTIPFSEMISDLGTSIVLVPVIGVLGNVAIAKAFASGQMIDATQELLTLSMCNVLGSFVSSMPITGSFSRSAVNHASGVQTPLGGIFTGVMVLLALSFLTPLFAFIPKTALAAVIISAVIFMIEYEVVKPMWRSSKKDLFATCATFVFCLAIGVEYGILVGVGINIVFLLIPSARPTVYVDKLKTPTEGVDYIVVTPGNSLYFPAVDFIKTSIGKAGVSSKNLPVVIDCRFILGADFTAAKGISALINEFVMRKQPLYFLNTREEVVALFRGVFDTDFKYFEAKEEIEIILDEKYKESIGEETTLLGELCTSQWRNSIPQLTEITCDKRSSYTGKSITND